MLYFLFDILKLRKLVHGIRYPLVVDLGVIRRMDILYVVTTLIRVTTICVLPIPVNIRI